MQSKWPYVLAAFLLWLLYGLVADSGLDFVFLLVALPAGCWVIYNLIPEKDRRW
ncbi:MAG TPA: hypothetical protein VFR47_06690 [Anaerolineales bacterium]|nr:hypothetical protein [Anaerolineales bacterium]